MQKNSSKDTVLFRRLLREARPYWGHISLIFGVSVLATPLALLIPLPLKIVVDSVLGDKPVPGFLAAITPQFFQASLASAERAFALLDESTDVVDKPHGKHLARAKGEIAFAGVSFGYKRDRLILGDVSFAIPPGGRVAITGATGSGKTTLAGLLSRFYDPTAGVISLDGVDLRDYRLADLRQQFAIVPQDPVLFSTTIGENIAYARPDAGEADILAAAKAANAHDFIDRLPDGYATVVGERGMSLSGGERQRISIARAFLKNAPILILDEPTSALDTETETILMEAMERLMRGRTSLTIAHRLSTVRNCDWRVHSEDGRVQVRRANVQPDEVVPNEVLA
jgi:ATP-binding cassette subfamily B protein